MVEPTKVRPENHRQKKCQSEAKLSPSEKAQRGSKRLKINKVWYIILAKGLQKGKNGYVTL